MLNPLIRAESVDGQSNEQPGSSDDEAGGENHEVDSWKDKGDGAVFETGLLERDGLLGGGKVGEDDVLGEDADEEDGFVEGDVGADAGAGGGYCGEGEGGHHESFEVGTGFSG